MQRRPTLYLTTTVLALVTASALAGTAFIMSSPAVGHTAPSLAADVVHRFYAAVNAAVATGDVEALETVVAPNYVEHLPLPGRSPDRAGLVRHLRALHAVDPDLRLEVRAVIAQRDEVMARVVVRAGTQPRFLGLPLTGRLAGWGPVDHFRVVGTQIVARWAAADGITVLEPGRHGAVAVERPADQFVSLARFSLLPDGQVTLGSWWGIRLIVVESGRLTLTTEPNARQPALISRAAGVGRPSAPQPAAPDATYDVSAGDLIALPETSLVTLHGATRTPAAVVSLTALSVLSFTGSDIPLPPQTEARRDVLAGGLRFAIPAGATTIAFGRIALAPGATFAVPSLPGPLLVWVEAGGTDLATVHGEAWVRAAVTSPSAREDRPTFEDEQSTRAAHAALEPGDGAAIPVGAGATLTNAGTAHATLLLVTLTPGDDGPPLARIDSPWVDDSHPGIP